METLEIRKKLHDYIDSAAEEKVKAIYTVLENDIKGSYNHWDDPEFVAEMDDRIKELENGTVRGIPMKEFFAKSKEYLNLLQQKNVV